MLIGCLPQDSTKAIPLLVESCIRYINLHGEAHNYCPSPFVAVTPWWSLSALLLLLLLSGLQHQGIFRVSGSQVEINDIKNSFERGETLLPCGHMTCWTWLSSTPLPPPCGAGNDPLIDEESNHDINSVAGVLKLYFRGLENPLFPKERFNDLISCVRKSRPIFFRAHCLDHSGHSDRWVCLLQKGQSQSGRRTEV